MGAGTVLVVCTGNVCRSPYIELRLRAALGETRIAISSAGTDALVGNPIDPGSAALLAKHGIDSSDFTARQLTAEMVRASDLVLTATRAHRAEVARTDPSGLRKAMTLVDFSDLVRDLPPGLPKPSFMDPPDMTNVARIVSGAARRREYVTPRSEEDAAIVDPFRQGETVFERMEAKVEQVIPAVVRGLSAADPHHD